MKQFLFLIFIFILFPLSGNAQFKQAIAMFSSYRQKYGAQQISLSGEYAIHLKSFVTGLAVGAECWSVQGVNSNATIKTSVTCKLEPWLGFESRLFHSNFKLSGSLGVRYYFLNQIEDRLSLYTLYDSSLTSHSRDYIQNLSTYVSPYNSEPSEKSKYSSVTSMPFAIV